MTHNGDPKPLHYAENKERFKRFNDRIIHVVADDFSPAEAGATFQERAWMRENIQRNSIAKGLEGATGDDIVMVSDMDEIPCAEKVRSAAAECASGEVVGFALAQYNFFLNLRNVSDPFWGNDPKMARISTFRDEAAYRTSTYSHFVLKAVNRELTATRFRYIRPVRRIVDAGWHFSYLGGIDAAVKKVRAFNEAGLYGKAIIEEFVRGRIAAGRPLVGSDHLMPESLDDSFPAYVLANKERFARLVYQHVPARGKWTAFLRKWYYASGCLRRFAIRMAFRLTPERVRLFVKRIVG